MTHSNTASIDWGARLAAVRGRIADAAVVAGRSAAEVTLIAVSKTHPWSAVSAVAAAGQRDFGENRVEEAAGKLAQPSARDLRWHMIGHVQSRKAADAAAVGFALIHSVDGLKLAERLSRAAVETGRRQTILLECNVSGEASKSGYAAADEPTWPALIDGWASLLTLPGVEVQGLMTMAPLGTDDDTARPVFDRLRRLAQTARARLGAALPVLSMGMTDDYVGAVREGATHVRVGRAIFGERGA